MKTTNKTGIASTMPTAAQAQKCALKQQEKDDRNELEKIIRDIQYTALCGKMNVRVRAISIANQVLLQECGYKIDFRVSVGSLEHSYHTISWNENTEK